LNRQTIHRVCHLVCCDIRTLKKPGLIVMHPTLWVFKYHWGICRSKPKQYHYSNFEENPVRERTPMKRLRFAFVISTLLFMVLSSCSYNAPTQVVPATATATEAPDNAAPQEALLKANQPGGITQATGPGGLSQSMPQVAECTPPALSVNSANGWCANYTSKTGGVTINMSGETGINTNNDVGASCTPAKDGFVCTGPQNASFHISTCSWCGGIDPYGGPAVDFSKAYGDYACSKGYSKNPANGFCQSTTSRYPDDICPAGSHYDNSQQWCVDDATNQKVTDLCPPGSVAYIPAFQFCLLQPLPTPMVFNCQTWTVTLGDCTLKHNSGGVAPVKPPCISSTAGCH